MLSQDKVEQCIDPRLGGGYLLNDVRKVTILLNKRAFIFLCVCVVLDLVWQTDRFCCCTVFTRRARVPA